MEVRRREDFNAMRSLGASASHLCQHECLYRGDAAGRARYSEEEEIFHEDPKREADTLCQVISALWSEVNLDKYSHVYIPLGIGRHIDHVIVRRSVERIFDQMPTHARSTLHYYEDIPYVCWDRDLTWRRRLTKGLVPEVRAADQRSWAAKMLAILCYQSQVRMLWKNRSEMEDQLGVYARSIGGETLAECLWSRRSG